MPAHLGEDIDSWERKLLLTHALQKRAEISGAESTMQVSRRCEALEKVEFSSLFIPRGLSDEL